MGRRFGWVVLALFFAAPASAQTELEKGFAGALRGCEEWVLNPASWDQGVESFLSTVGLGDKMGLVESVNEAALPPPEWRVANHYWRINSTADAGYILVVSDQLPICHITGGGNSDLQPVIEAVLTSDDFQSRWEKLDENSSGDLVSTRFKSRDEPSFSMTISRAKKADQRRDRVQVLASASMELGN